MIDRWGWSPFKDAGSVTHLSTATTYVFDWRLIFLVHRSSSSVPVHLEDATTSLSQSELDRSRSHLRCLRATIAS
jgi:hypothetical protein